LRVLIASLRLVVLKKRRLSRFLPAFPSFVSISLLYTLLEDEGKFHSRLFQLRTALFLLWGMSLFIRTALFSVYMKPRTLFVTLITRVAWRERNIARLYDAHLWKHDWLSIHLLLNGYIFWLGLSLFKI